WPRPRCASDAANGIPSSAKRRAGARSREPRPPPLPATSVAPVQLTFAALCARGPGGSAPAHAQGSSRWVRQTDVASGPRRIEGRMGDSPCHTIARLIPPAGYPGLVTPISFSDCGNPDSMAAMEPPLPACGQGNRVNFSCSDEACEKVVIPGCDLAPETQRVLAGNLSEQVMGHVFDGGEIGRGVIGSDAALVVAEDHVHDPMQAVLDCPVAAHDRSEEGGQHDQ